MAQKDQTLVAITGTLSLPRKEVVLLIETKTNARFSEQVTYETNYLIAARFDTLKARKAAKIGVPVVSEADLWKFIAAGQFPERAHPVRPPTNWHPHEYFEWKWQHLYDPFRVCYLEYRDSAEEISERYVLMVGKGKAGKFEYWGAYDHECFKTFRLDRILALEDLGPVETADTKPLIPNKVSFFS